MLFKYYQFYSSAVLTTLFLESSLPISKHSSFESLALQLRKFCGTYDRVSICSAIFLIFFTFCSHSEDRYITTCSLCGDSIYNIMQAVASSQL